MGILPLNDDREQDLDFVKFKMQQRIDDTHEVRLVPIKELGGDRVIFAKKSIKIVCAVALFIFVFFRPFVFNSFYLLVRRGYFQTVSFTVRDSNNVILQQLEIITQNSGYYLTTGFNI